MAYNWKIIKAAVEQEILFPNKAGFDSYIRHISQKDFPYEVVDAHSNEDGTFTAIIRKRYNPGNEFFPEKDRRKHGKWEYVDGDLGYSQVKCTACGFTTVFGEEDSIFPNCPICTAVMDL